jgi:hypothetical protein
MRAKGLSAHGGVERIPSQDTEPKEDGELNLNTSQTVNLYGEGCM